MNNEEKRLRDIKIIPNFIKHPAGSVLIEFGDTKVICTASIEEKVPPFLKNTGTGWVSAEYSMIPGSTEQRKVRDATRGKIDGRAHEIQRLIGRSLRAVVDFKKLGERTIWIDCDVIQADGGTRTASITGAYVALALACNKLLQKKIIKKFPLNGFVAAVSVGIVNDTSVLDLCYKEDSIAQVDMNVVMTDKNEFIEIQGTGEERPYTKIELDDMIELAKNGCNEIFKLQEDVLGEDITNLIKLGELKETRPKEAKEIFDNSVYRDNYGRLEVVVASSNIHKIQEIQKILEKINIKLISLKDVGLEGIEIIEDGNSFEENALIKSREISKRTGKIALSDDSGLVVNALGGQPGIYSARFAGKNATDFANNNKLLELMKNEADRSAHFVSVIGITFPDGREQTYKGITHGEIGYEEVGNKGFGYDPLFIVKDKDKTYAEMTEEEKNTISHRARALRVLQKNFSKILSEE
ncbi:MAG: ribonuclease PH [Filifactoraceae bacterium]